MTNRLNILTRLALLLTLVAGGACSHEDVPLPDVPQPTDRATLGITIGVDGATRAVTEDPAYGGYEPGSGYENYLDIARSNYRIYFFDTQNDPKYIGTFTPINKPVMNPSPEDIPEKDHENVLTYYYTFMGDVPRDLPTKFKLVVLANWEQYPEEGSGESSGLTLVKGETTLAQLCSSAESQFAALTSPGDGDWLGPNRLIPFYGVREYDLNQIAPDYIEDGKIKGDVLIDLRNNRYALPLLRAMARVEVILDNPYASFSSVRMTKVNTRGYCAPEEAFSHTDYTHALYDDAGNMIYGYDWDKDFIRAVHLTGDDKVSITDDNTNDSNPGILNFKKVTTDRQFNSVTGQYVGEEKWVAYLPEYKNIGGNDFTTIEVTLADPRNNGEYKEDRPAWTNPTNTIYFATYGSEESNSNDCQAELGEDGTYKPGRYNIERNNVYRFTITDMSADFTCDVDIQPFAEVKLGYDLGLMRDERGDLMIVPDEKGEWPQFFYAFMQTHAWPTDKNGVKLEPQFDSYKQGDHDYMVNEDYYAIIMGENGLMSNATVWLKDKTGCKVLSNFTPTCSGSDSYNCYKRSVTQFSSRIDLTGRTYDKDRQCEEIIHHYKTNHWSIVYDPENKLVFKENNNDFANQKRYLVESWDEDTEICWIIQNEEVEFIEQKTEDGKKYNYYKCTYYLRKINKDGTFTTGEEEENYIVATETEKREVEE